MKRLREILRDQHIGAIAIGFLLFQALAALVSTIMQPIIAYVENRQRPPSIFAPARSIFNWPQITLNGISIFLNLVVALLLILWLYRKQQPQPEAAPPAASDVRKADSAAAIEKPEEPL